MNFTRLFQAVCLVLSISVFSATQGPPKQTPAGRQLAGWLAAYDGSNWNAYALFVWDEKPPFSRDREKSNISDPIGREDPHEKEMVAQSLGRVVRRIDCLPEPLWKEAEEGDLSYADTVNRVRMLVSIVKVIPINQEIAPHHDEKYREIDPMHPSDRKRMLSIETKRHGWRGSFLHHCNVLPQSYESSYS